MTEVVKKFVISSCLLASLFSVASAQESELSPSARAFGVTTREPTVYVGDAPENHVLPPEITPPVRVNKEAPGPFIAMKRAYDDGDMNLANKYADQYVKYMQRLIFEVRELSSMIGEALLRQGQLDEEDLVGVGQYLSKEMAQVRMDKKELLQVTAEMGLERIEPDPRQQAEVYVFCSVSSRFCREMAPDVERMYQIARRDSRIKFGFYMIGEAPKGWASAFKQYTGLTAPIQDGTEIAKAMRIGFVPAVVIRSPSTNKSYLRTGVLPIERLYEFVRAVQGESRRPSDREMEIIQAKVGQSDELKTHGVISAQYNTEPNGGAVYNLASHTQPAEHIERF